MTPDPHELEGVRRRQPRRGFPLLLIALLLLAILGCLILLTPLGEKLARNLKELLRPPEEAPVATKEESEQPSAPTVTEPPEAPIEPDAPAVEPGAAFPAGVLWPPDGVDIRELSKGINLEVKFETEEGGLASLDRQDDDAYVAKYTLKVRLPRAAATMAELSKVNPELNSLLPGLAGMVEKEGPGGVSPWYRQLYANKAARLKANVGRLDRILTRHNFYDCETMLNLRHAGSERRVFLLQADMDVVSDGSDGDRLPAMPDRIVNSTHYQPFTSYRWKKTGTRPNPMIAGWEKRIGNARKEMEDAKTTDERKAWLRERIGMLERGIADMKVASYLIAEYDPFIVIPMNIITDRRDEYAPNVGDFAVVIHGKTLYPAIVGDAGPTFKVGEASLRLAKEINSNASPYSRPVSDLTVTYLVFPRTAESPKRAPDYAHWRKRCGELLEEIGGLGEGVQLHDWADLLPPLEDEAEKDEAGADAE